MGFTRSAILSAFHAILPLLPSFISSRFYAALLILNLARKDSGDIISKEINLTEKHIAATTYSLSPHVSPRTRTLMVVHGVSYTGPNDPRVVQLSRAIARSNPNNLVIAPLFAPLARCRMADGTIEVILDVIESLSSDSRYCPSGRISIVSPCVSAGFSLVAASHTDRVESMMCIGAHATIRNFLAHTKSRMGKDDSRYGINATLASCLEPPNARLSAMLAAYCKDDHLGNVGIESNELEPLLKRYPEEAKIYHRLHNDDEFLAGKLDEMYNAHEEILLKMSPAERVKQVKLDNLVLIHAVKDDIVPPSESKRLAEAFERCGNSVHVRLLFTSVLNHGDKRAVGPSDLLEIWRLIDCMSAFYGPKAATRSTKPVAGKKT